MHCRVSSLRAPSPAKKNAFDRPIEKVLATVIEVARVVEELEHRRIEGV